MNLPINEVKLNPDNPRYIKDDKFKKLVQSLSDFPEMASVRPIVVNKEHIILGGNMRYRAMVAAGWKEVPVTVVDWPEDKQREFIIKDNVSGGQWDWDILANDWGTADLDGWGVDLPSDWDTKEESDEPTEDNSNFSTIIVVAYEDINDLDKITQLYHLEAIDMPSSVKEEITSQRKVYVFKK